MHPRALRRTGRRAARGRTRWSRGGHDRHRPGPTGWPELRSVPCRRCSPRRSTGSTMAARSPRSSRASTPPTLPRRPGCPSRPDGMTQPRPARTPPSPSSLTWSSSSPSRPSAGQSRRGPRRRGGPRHGEPVPHGHGVGWLVVRTRGSRVAPRCRPGDHRLVLHPSSGCCCAPHRARSLPGPSSLWLRGRSRCCSSGGARS